jgi:type II secretory pathway component PulK
MYVIKRSGFAMILAIFVVVLVALGGALLLSNASTGVKSTGDNYIKAQAELLAMSATEFAVMRAQGFNRTTNNCLNQLNIEIKDAGNTMVMYDANVSYGYSFRGAKFNNACSNVLAENTSKDTMILMDVVVTARESANLSTEPIRIHKRSWQKL